MYLNNSNNSRRVRLKTQHQTPPIPDYGMGLKPGGRGESYAEAIIARDTPLQDSTPFDSRGLVTHLTAWQRSHRHLYSELKMGQ